MRESSGVLSIGWSAAEAHYPQPVAHFIDQQAEFLYVPSGDVLRIAKETGAIPYDIPGVELSHDGNLCSFDAFLKKYGLDDPALAQLAVIVRGADTRATGSRSAGRWAARPLTRVVA